MKNISKRKIRIFSLLLALITISLCIGVFATEPVVPVGTVRRAAYQYSVDSLIDTVTEKKVFNSVGGSSIGVVSKGELKKGSDLQLEGWLATDGGVAYYEYLIDDGVWTAFSDENMSIRPRTDIKSKSMGFGGDADKTAGFTLTVSFDGLEVGGHDIFIRAVTNDNAYCEFLVLFDIVYGEADKEAGNYLQISLGKYDGDGYITKAGAYALELKKGLGIKLGTYKMKLFKNCIIECKKVDSKQACALKLSFGGQSRAVDCNSDTVKFEVTADISDYNDQVDLYIDGENLYVTRVLLEYTRPVYCSGDVCINMSSTPQKYMNGMNCTLAKYKYDDTVGEYMAVELSTDTNDPYAYFNIERYMKEQRDTAINADEYKYLVMCVRAYRENSNNWFQLFLCSGNTTGPTGGISTDFTTENDGKWHYYVIDLSRLDFWNGKVHGLRFDIMSGNNLKQGETVDIASVQFFTTLDSAEKAAKSGHEPYYEFGQPVEKTETEAETQAIPYQNKKLSEDNTHINNFNADYADCFTSPNYTDVGFDADNNLVLTANGTTNDPFVTFNISDYMSKDGRKTPEADTYKFLILKIYASKKISGKNFQCYYMTTDHPYAEGTHMNSANYYCRGEWEYLIIDLSGRPNMEKDFIGVRLDWATNVMKDDYLVLSDIWFADSEDNAKKIADADKAENTTAAETTDFEEITSEAITWNDLNGQPLDPKSSEVTSGTEKSTEPGTTEPVTTEPATTEPATRSGCSSTAAMVVTLAALSAIPFVKKKKH